ncbi:ASCH domain-containing protein [Algiphilus sp.]|uniref:ASCH domain-containing protein n=1 Tax=Algiphilus sp. TaxID=1872431 RepID=UPI003BADBDC1
MKALSIRQPWAHRILHEGKDIENRSWPTQYRGDFLIHAGISPDGDVTGAMPRGGIVGIASITDCVRESDSRWFNGPYGFVLAHARPLPFIPMRGQLGFFTVDLRDAAVDLWRRDEISEGPASRMLGMSRLDFRALCDAELEAARDE